MISEDDIEKNLEILVKMGYGREEGRDALLKANNSINDALEKLNERSGSKKYM